MIQANQLRIGNWIKREVEVWDWDKKIKVGPEKVSLGTFFTVNEYPEDFGPINLTPEILEKAGLKLEVYGHNGEREVAMCDISNRLAINDEMEVIVDQDKVPHVKYVHQLQNLYFALTGTELNIEL